MFGLTRALPLALAALLLSGATAHAADTLTVTFGADPTEEVPVPITATWSSADPDPFIYVTVKPDGPLGCGSSYVVDAPNSTAVISTQAGATGPESRTWTAGDPGTSILCGYLLDEPGDTTPLAVTGPLALPVRSGRATLALQAPASVDRGKPFTVTAAVSTELSRALFVTIKPTGGSGCEATYALEEPASIDVLYKELQGNQTVTAGSTASKTPGTYLLCGYVTEGSADPAPEAVASATIRVGPDPCDAAQDKVIATGTAVKTAQSAVTRYRKSSTGFAKKAKHSRGAKRASYKRLAKRDKRRFDAAVRKRATARAAYSAAQMDATALCGQGAGLG